MQKRVTGLGGISLKCKNPQALRDWYSLHLGFNTDQYGTTFQWIPAGSEQQIAHSVWSTFDENTNYFQPSEKGFMVNLRVNDLEGLLAQLKTEGIESIGDTQHFDYGKFAHIIDPDGIKIELWEPNDELFAQITEGHITPAKPI